MITLANGTQVTLTGAGLLMMLEDFEGKDIVIQQSGLTSTTKCLDNVDVAMIAFENGNRTLWLNGDDEDFYTVDMARVKWYGKDPISGNINIEMDNNTDLMLYEQ